MQTKFHATSTAAALLKKQAIADGHARIDRLIERYDRAYVSKYSHDDYLEYFQRCQELEDEQTKISEEIVAELKDKGLSLIETEQVQSLLSDYFVRKFARQNREWQQRLNPDAFGSNAD